MQDKKTYQYLENNPKISKNSFIADGVKVVGRVNIGASSSVWYNSVIRGDVNYVKIGKNTNIQDGSIVHVSRLKNGFTEIGDNVTIGHQTLIHACIIEDEAFVGMQSMVMDGAIIKKGAMVAAGSLVSPNTIIPENELWIGRPAKFFRKISKQDKEMMEEITKNYIKLAQEHKKSTES
jgi:carbonic anhydrase/acetyltransferase-like protein (isoleucine patch superfamily)